MKATDLEYVYITLYCYLFIHLIIAYILITERLVKINQEMTRCESQKRLVIRFALLSRNGYRSNI